MVALLQHMWDPPVEGGLVVDTSGHGKFCGLDGVRFLKIRKVLPGSQTIFPLEAQLPASGIASFERPSAVPDHGLV